MKYETIKKLWLRVPFFVHKLAGVLAMLAIALWAKKEMGWGLGGFLLTYLVLSMVFIVYLLLFTRIGKRQLAALRFTVDLLHAKRDAEKKIKEEKLK